MKKWIAALALIPLVGCTQVAQLQQVAGAEVTAVRIATNDVLVDQNVPIVIAPVCSSQADLYVCEGTARGDRPIRSEATVEAAMGATKTEYGADTPAVISLKVTVGAREIFNGKVEDVLAQNAQESKCALMSRKPRPTTASRHCSRRWSSCGAARARHWLSSPSTPWSRPSSSG